MSLEDALKELPPKTLEEKQYLLKFKVDEKESHLKIIDPAACLRCRKKQCVAGCPSNVYKWEEERITIAYEGCVECGTCRIICFEFDNIGWRYPRGGYGVSYRLG